MASSSQRVTPLSIYSIWISIPTSVIVAQHREILAGTAYEVSHWCCTLCDHVWGDVPFSIPFVDLLVTIKKIDK